MNTGFALLTGAALGAGAMYYLDPDRGRRRRALVRDQAIHLENEAEDAAEAAGGKAQHLKNRAKGLKHEAQSSFGGQ